MPHTLIAYRQRSQATGSCFSTKGKWTRPPSPTKNPTLLPPPLPPPMLRGPWHSAARSRREWNPPRSLEARGRPRALCFVVVCLDVEGVEEALGCCWLLLYLTTDGIPSRPPKLHGSNASTHPYVMQERSAWMSCATHRSALTSMSPVSTNAGPSSPSLAASPSPSPTTAASSDSAASSSPSPRSRRRQSESGGSPPPPPSWPRRRRRIYRILTNTIHGRGE